MPFCPRCGASVEGKFCASCGTPVEAPPQQAYAPPPQPGYPPPPGYAAQPQPYPQPVASTGMQENVASALCYVLGFITGILFLVLEPYNKNRNIRFHAFQSIFLSVFFAIVHWVIIFLGAASYGVFFLLSPLISICFLVLWIFMMYKAYNNQMVKLPVIGDIAQKQAG
jgi:uncharacterized membrane protein